jgi:hypothetical protein
MRFTIGSRPNVRILCAILVALLVGCGVLEACPLGQHTADTDTTSIGYASVSVKDAWTYPITVNEVPAEKTGFLSGENCGYPLSPQGFVLQPGETKTMTGIFTGCYDGAPQTVWLFISGGPLWGQSCDYAVLYSPLDGSFAFPFIESVSGDLDCTRQHDNGTASIFYNAPY